MAQELFLSIDLRFSKSGRKVTSAGFDAQDLLLTVNGTDYIHRTQSIATSATALNLGSIGTPGYCIVKNKDGTNYVTIRSGASGADVIKLKAGEVASFRLATSTPYAIANGAACEIEYIIIED